ncbi:MAG: hypothetical protein CVU44_01065 [Chloroflexi bacterium HGW-Chloroflexi-6]|nr:MAG: hypothetical protein CVU44_01065 [Chloroflexi bacterium HGW-Chloroflexi-6]
MNFSLMDIIPLLVAAAVGYLIGLLDKWVTSGLKQKKQEKQETLASEKTSALLASQQARLEQAAKELAARDQTIKEITAKQEAQASSEQSALRVSFDENQNCLVELDGQRVPAGELTTEQRQRLVGIVVQIRPWIDGKPVPKASPASQPVASPPPPAPQPRVPLSSYPASSPLTGPPPRIDPIRGLRGIVEKDITKKDSSNLVSVVALIDQVLQRQLVNTPLESRRIKLEEGPHGEVQVHVGAVRYASIDEVPQPEIQAAIKNAIAEFNS